jgi:hypothetical protein
VRAPRNNTPALLSPCSDGVEIVGKQPRVRNPTDLPRRVERPSPPVAETVQFDDCARFLRPLVVEPPTQGDVSQLIGLGSFGIYAPLPEEPPRTAGGSQDRRWGKDLLQAHAAFLPATQGSRSQGSGCEIDGC